jgi:FecR protein
MQLSFSRQRRALPLVLAVTLSLMMPSALTPAAFAQDDGSAEAAPGPVARVDALSGDVAIQRGDDNSTLAAVPNAPVLGADYITTGQDGRAEVGFDGRSAVRLGENVQIRFVDVDPANRQMQLAAGTIELRLFGDTDGQSTIDTPSISVIPRTAGSFRVSVDANGETAVTVRAGRADIVTPQGNQPLEPGTTLIADGPAANPQLQTLDAIALDDFDSYNGDRDHIYLAASAQGQYVNTNIQGVGDLAANGQWVDDSSYGNVWIPTTVAAGWAPYRNGNWVWEDGYGWTWVAAEPWGWAPYHYGRWYFSTAYHQWAWYPPAPGRIAPAWSPALVGFVGFNIGAVSVGIGFGNIGWVPLAPYEAFHPWWGPHATTIVNNTTIINNNVHYRNIAVNGAFTSVTRENFQNGRFGNPMVVSTAQLRTIQTVPMRGALPIVPSQANLRFTQRAVSPSLAVHAQFANRGFAGAAAGAPARMPFTAQQASVARVTHVAYHPQAPGYAAPSYGNDSWSRFSTTRSNAAGGSVPAYARPAAPAYSQPQYNRQSSPGYSQPQYNRQATPEYSQPQYNRQPTPGYAQPQYNRPSTPGYSRPAAPASSRPATPSYNRPGAPAYGRAAPAYSRPAPASHPQAHATHNGDNHHD